MSESSTVYRKGAIIGRTGKKVMAKLQEEARAGRIHSAGEQVLITRGQYAGQYAVPVRFIDRPVPRQETPAWARVALVLGVAMLAPSMLLLMVMWVLTTLSTLSLVVLLVAVLAAFSLWLRAKYGRPQRGATVTTTVSFH